MTSAKPFVAAGGSVQASAGETSSPSQVYFAGIAASASKDELVSCSVSVACFMRILGCEFAIGARCLIASAAR